MDDGLQSHMRIENYIIKIVDFRRCFSIEIIDSEFL